VRLDNTKAQTVQSKTTSPSNPNPAGRPFGKAQLQRMRESMPLVTIAGVIYIKDQAGRRILAEPQKKGARR